jgi:hypothetical protein
MPPTEWHFASGRDERAMDARDFDALTKRLEAVLDRRGSVRAALAALGALAGAAATADDGEARNRRHRRKTRRTRQRCASGLTFCDGYCVDLGSNFTNCGRCGRRCSGAESCQNGECVTPDCEPGQKRCNDICVDPRRDPQNCGTCGNACRATQGCANGKCAPCDVCASGCAFDSVQAAVDAAAPGSTVTICAGTYTETLNVARNLTLVGLGPDRAATVLIGDETFVPAVTTDTTVTLRNLTAAGNGAAVFGIDNFGTLALEAVAVVAHQNRGIRNFGQRATLTVTDSLIADNRTATDGGGINNFEGTVTLVRTRVSGNTARRGGGIATTGGRINVDDGSAVTGNTATGTGSPGGGIFNNGGTVSVNGGSVSGNTPDDCVEIEGGTGCPA